MKLHCEAETKRRTEKDEDIETFSTIIKKKKKEKKKKIQVRNKLQAT